MPFRCITLALALLWLPIPLPCAAEVIHRGTTLASVVDDPAASGLVEVFQCRFDESWDVNYDDWPDRWTRVTDLERPHYVRMHLAEGDSQIQGKRLVIHPDGASARASSPPIHVMPKFSYILTMRLRAVGVKYGHTAVRLTFLDAEGNPRQVEASPTIRSDGEWVDVHIGAFQPTDPAIDRMVIHLDFDRGNRSDLEAQVSVADIRLWRLPSITVHTGSLYNVYTDPKDVTVTCSLSGILERNPEIRFQLLDATNRSIGDEGVLELHGELISESSAQAKDIIDGFGNEQVGFEGTIEWKPPIQDYGFYRVRVQMISSETGKVLDEPAITVAVVRENLETTERGEFGWALPNADRPLPFGALLELLPRAGVSLVKVPVWYPVGDETRGDQLMDFSSRLAASDIEMVGMLADPTERMDNPLAEGPPPPIESLLATSPERWVPIFDHVITKLSLQVRWWQLGYDRDTSFVGASDLVQRILDIRHQMFRFGQDIRLGLGWRWEYLQNWPAGAPLDFQQMSARENLDSNQLGNWLDQAPPKGMAERWVHVEPTQDPINAQDDIERHQTRVRDFVEQIIVAKVHHANGIFVVDPFSGDPNPESGKTGVMNQDGTPGELLLPWRTCARLLGGATYLGQIQMPQQSRNWLFRRTDGTIVMVLWNQKATQETLYLGEQVQVIDIWGKTRPPEEAEGRQVIPVDRMPRFIFGLSEEIARWRMETHFEEKRVPSVFGMAHPNQLRFRNTFSQGVGGTARLFVENVADNPQKQSSRSAGWDLVPDQSRLSLAAGAAGEHAFSTMLVEAGYGKQPVRIEFEIEGDRKYRFSVWRHLHVGLGDLRLAIQTELDNGGRLMIRQQMQNFNGTPANFKCQLYAPPSRRKRVQVFQLSSEVDKKAYSFLNGEAMLGREVKLRIEEIDGNRVLIYRFVVDPSGSSTFDSREAEANDAADSDSARQAGNV